MLKQLLLCSLVLGLFVTTAFAARPHHKGPAHPLPAHPLPTAPSSVAKPQAAPTPTATAAPLPAPAADTPEPPPYPFPVARLEDAPGVAAFLDGAIQVGMERHHATGAVVAVVKDGRVLFSRGYGRADLDKGTAIDPDTSLFRVGSITKTFTWTAVMQLVDEGKIDLDQDVNSYLKTGTAHIPPGFGGKPVTMRTLMTHTAGFEDAALGFLIQTDARRQLPIVEAVRLHRPERVRAPGEMTAYSNYGAALAGLVVEEVSGEPYSEYVEKRVFGPLGMLHSTVQEPVPEKLAAGLTTGYHFVDGRQEPQPFEITGGFRPAGGASVTASDMTHFMLAQLQDGRYEDHQLLKPETVQLMHTVAFRLDPRLPGMTLGFYQEDVNGHEAIAHGGDTLHYHSDMVLLPKDNMGLFLSFISQDGGAVAEVENAFFARYFPRRAQEQPRLDDTIAHLLAAKYSGSYEWTRRNHTNFEKLLTLTQELNVEALPNGNLVVNGLESDPVQFEPIASDMYRDVLDGDLRLAFRSNALAQPTHLFFSNLPFMPAERTPWYEQDWLWSLALGLSFLLLLPSLLALYYRSAEIKAMPQTEQRAVWAAASTAACALLAGISLIIVLRVTDADTLASRIPAALTVVLALPILLVALTLWLSYTTLQVWRESWWTLPRRIGYSVALLAALILCVFCVQWNLLGWRFG